MPCSASAPGFATTSTSIAVVGPPQGRVTDPTRLAALAATGLIPGGIGSAHADTVLDRLARTATRLLGVPVALVSLVDGEAQHFAGLAGLGGEAGARRGTPLSHSFCQHVVAAAEALVVEDAAQHPVLRENGAHRELGVVAYAGVPLTTSDGETLGAFCAIDTAPHAWTEDQLAGIRDLAAAAVAELELRIANRRLAEREAALAAERTFLHDVLDALEEHVAVASAEGRPALMNRAARATLNAESAIAAPATEWGVRYGVFTADGVTPFAEGTLAHERVFATGAPALGVEFVLRTPGRDARTFIANAYPLRGSDGVVTSAVVASRDVTEQRLADRALAEREARLDLIYNGASDLMFLMRVERDAADVVVAYRCESVNTAYRAATGLTDAGLVGRTVHDILPPAAAGFAHAQYERAVATAAIQRYDESVDLPTGRLVVETTLTPVHDAGGRCTHLLGAARDVTARRRAEAGVALLQRVTRAVSTAEDADAALLVALEALCAATGWPYGEVWLPTADDARLELGPVWLAAGQRNPKYVEFAESSRHYTFRAGESIAGRVWETGAPMWVPELGADGPCARWALTAQVGFRAGVGVPVLADGLVVAVLLAFSPAPDSEDAHRVELMATVAAQIGDVVRRKRAEDARAASEAQLARIYNGTSDVMFLVRVECDAAGGVADYRYESVNATCQTVTGLRDAQVIGHTIEEVLPPKPAAFSRGRYDEAVRTGAIVRYDQSLLVPAGRVVLETTITPVLDAAGRCTHLLGAARDVSAVRRAEAELRAREAELRGVLAASPDCIKTLDLDGRLLSINETGCRLLELDGPDQIVGHEFAAFFPEDDHRVAVTAALDAARGGGRGHVQAPAPSARGTPKWWDVAVTPIPGPDGAPARLLCVSREITAMKRAEAELRALSDRDELTGLLNRRGFRALAEPTLAMGRRAGRCDAVVYIDLDAFKPINDVFGHAAGDAALQAVARVLTDTVRQSDLVARLGGDEFAVYAAGLARPGEGALLAARLRTALAAHNQAASAAGRPWSVAMSVGVADVEPGDELDALLARADAAAYAAKRAGRMAAV